MDIAKDSKHNKYFLFIAYLQIIGIVLVVLGHSFHEYPDGHHGDTMLMYKMLHSFRMPLFIFVSGFLMAFTTSSKPRTWGRFATMKFKRLLIPYVVLTLVTFVPRALMSGMADDSVELSWHGLGMALASPEKNGLPYLWFLQSSLTLLLVVYGLLSLCRTTGIKSWIFYTGISIAILILNFIPLSYPDFLSLHMTVMLGIYFVAGCVYSTWQEQIDRKIRWESIWVFLLFGVLWAVAFFLSQATDFPIMICSFLGILMMISLAKILEDRDITFLYHLKGANYIIFLLSWYFNVACQQVLHHFTDLPWWVYSLLSFTLGIYVPWIFYKWMCLHPDNRFTRVSAFLLGQSIKSRNR